MISSEFALNCIFKILFSVISGIILGIERKHRLQVIGMRTLVLISVSSTLLSIISYTLTEIQTGKNFYGGDPTRIIAGVVSGIGFLGGGAIIHQGLNIKGLTSAAVIWTASALGLAIGVGLYTPSLVVLGVAIFMLLFLEKVEEKFFPAGRSKALHLVFGDEKVNLDSVTQVLETNGFKVTDYNISRIMSCKQIILRYSVKAPKSVPYNSIIEELGKLGEIQEFTITD